MNFLKLLEESARGWSIILSMLVVPALVVAVMFLITAGLYFLGCTWALYIPTGFIFVLVILLTGALFK